MAAAPAERSDQADLVHLVVSVPLGASVEDAARVLEDGATGWLGDRIADGDAPDGMRRHLTDLQLRVSDHPTLVTFRKAAYVDLGPILPLNGGWQMEIGWRAATLAPLFPVFAGELVARDGVLIVSGFYAPPGGGIGMVADRMLLNIAARGTARWLLQRIADVAAGRD